MNVNWLVLGVVTAWATFGFWLHSLPAGVFVFLTPTVCAYTVRHWRSE